MKGSFVFLFLIPAQSLLAAPESLTLEQSIEIAVQNATPVLQARNNDDAAASQLIQGYAQFLPNLQAAAAFGYENGRKFSAAATPTLVVTENYGPSYQVSSTLNIFNGFADYSSLRSSIARRQLSSLSLKRASQLVALDVTQSFLQTVLDEKIIRIAESSLKASQERQKVLEEKVKLGSASHADLARQEAQTSADESFLSNAQNRRKIDILTLIQKLRLDVDKDYELLEPSLAISETIDLGDAAEGEYINAALANRPDLHASKKNADAAEWDVSTLRSSFFPKLDLQVSLNSNARILATQLVNGANVVPPTQDPMFGQLGNHNYLAATLNLTWEIFDRWKGVSASFRADATARNLRIDASDKERQVIADVKTALSDLRTSIKQIESTTKGALAAQRAFELVNGRFAEGFASFTDVAAAQAAMVSAEAAHAQALIANMLQQRALKTALGAG